MMNPIKAIEIIETELKCLDRNDGTNCDRNCESCDLVMDVSEIKDAFYQAIEALEKQTPKNVAEDVDRSWGIPRKQAVCPECDCFLGEVHFLGDGQRKIIYCDRCGQAVDFSEWEEGKS